MTVRGDSGTAFAALVKRARGFWAYYRRYTKTAIHSAATAALTAFGLLIFIDPSFAWLAIASYLLPPVVLYAIGSDAGAEDEGDPDRSTHVSRSARNGESVGADPDSDSDGSSAAVADEDRDGVDHDADGPDLDYDGPDADADGPDRDYDGPALDYDGPDRDVDAADHDHDGSDGPDRDADGADSDADGADADADGADVDRDG